MKDGLKDWSMIAPLFCQGCSPPPPCSPCVCVCQVRGLSNLFWGWGREDDELYLRMKEAGMTVSGGGHTACVDISL